jgi:hypothetical protein
MSQLGRAYRPEDFQHHYHLAPLAVIPNALAGFSFFASVGIGRPRENRIILSRGLSVLPGELSGVGGTPFTIISAAVFRSNQAKGAQNCAPFLLP